MLLTTSVLSKTSFFGSLLNKCRPAAVASFSSPSAGLKTLEEQVGLPPRPKKPLTPYFRYMQEMRPKLIAENPGTPLIELVRLISKKWTTADPSLKKKLQADYKKEQEIYVEKRAKYDAKISDDQRAEMKQIKQDLIVAKERKNLRKRVKELGRPKKPASAYLRFIVQERNADPQKGSMSYRDWHQKCTAKWSRMLDEEKEVYLQESRKELEVYKKEIALWEEKMVRLGYVDVVRHSNLIDPPEPKSRGKTIKSAV